MEKDIIRNVKSRVVSAASQMTFKSVFYKWSLSGGTPDHFLVIPPDAWPGVAEHGRWICNDAISLDGQKIPLYGRFWSMESASRACLQHMHGFDWLRDLRAQGGDVPRLQARALIAGWCHRYNGWDATFWRPDILGRRVANWISLYPFYGESADENFQGRLMESLIRQARHLSRAITSGVEGLPLLYAIRGLVYCGLAFEGREGWLEQALDLLERETKRQILPDGGHVSRSSSQLLEATRCFIDIRGGLVAGGYPVPEQIEHTIDRMAQALRFFRYTDKNFALFNGASAGNEVMADAVLLHAGSRGRTLRNLPHTGYERMTVGRTVLMMDTGAPPAFPYDDAAHAAPLAFEMMYGKEQIFVSCGTHSSDDEWKNVLRATAAHNTLTLDHRNACEIREDGHFARRARKVSVQREENNHAVLLDCSHDGYVPMNGVTHRRRLYLADGGHNLRGEENLTCTVGLAKPVDVCVRFHLHPRVQVSMIQEGKEALLRLPGGAGWRFFHQAGTMTLEDSIFLNGSGKPRKTKQLVIHGRMESDHAQIKWALQREGLSE